MSFILFSLIGLAFILSLFLTPLVRSFALKWNLVDSPDARKVHKKPIPRVGGIAVAIAFFGSCLVVGGLFTQFHLDFPLAWTTLKAIGPATGLIFLVGLADDLLNLRPWQKFLVQIVASLMVIAADVHLGNSFVFAGHPILARAVTVFWLLLCTNAVNLIDGLDGLASGVALLAAMTTLAASLATGNNELALAAAPLIGALLGFLIFNSNPASIFLGDSGSLVLGFLLGCFSLLWSAHSTTVLGMTAPLMALTVPLLDTTLAIVRRMLRAKPLFMPDRSHIHHRLLALGLTHRRAVLSLYAAGIAASALALSLVWANGHNKLIIVLVFISAVLLGIEKLSYPELNTAKKVLLRRGLRREINAQLEVQNLRETLTSAQTAEDCWTAVQRNSSELGFDVVRMHLAQQTFGQTEETESPSTIRIAISQDGWVDLSIDSNAEHHPNVLIPFADTMRQVLADKDICFVEPLERTAHPAMFHDISSPTTQ